MVPKATCHAQPNIITGHTWPLSRYCYEPHLRIEDDPKRIRDASVKDLIASLVDILLALVNLNLEELPRLHGAPKATTEASLAMSQWLDLRLVDVLAPCIAIDWAQLFLS
jgi:hypothetical protein